MEKFTCLTFVFLVLFLTGCGSKHKEEEKIDITDIKFNVEVCNKYYELAECVIDKSQNINWTWDMKDQLRNNIKLEQDEWSKLSEDELVKQCSYKLSRLEAAPDLDEIWCSIK